VPKAARAAHPVQRILKTDQPPLKVQTAFDNFFVNLLPRKNQNSKRLSPFRYTGSILFQAPTPSSKPYKRSVTTQLGSKAVSPVTWRSAPVRQWLVAGAASLTLAFSAWGLGGGEALAIY